LRFEWDPDKAETNIRKHGVSFSESCLVFADPFVLSFPDPDHSGDEDRWISLGVGGPGKLLIVVHTYRKRNGDEIVQIITARRATVRERRQYRKRTP
jgi:uncharacterized protein